MKNKVEKYNVPGPRYTSYPTVPYWDENTFSVDAWKRTIQTDPDTANNSISLYIHLPFCESLCTFCACNKRITRRHDVERPYIDAVIREFDLYLSTLTVIPKVRELHLGGGTPTFFSPENLERLIYAILSRTEESDHKEFSFEGHPNNTTYEHLKTLYDLGFRRVSFGIQDYNPKIQTAIHRVQSFENVKRPTEVAREIGYTSVGHDLIFGLPHQQVADIENTIALTSELMPDRIAFYSYAHVPWIKGNGQRGFKEEDLPAARSKREQYEIGKRKLEEAGYFELGMDHFALPTDTLYQAYQQGKMHRNFMGYTTMKTTRLIGLGVSAISDSWYGFAQNEKKLEDYYEKLNSGQLPVFRGHILSDKDLIIRQHILNLMCQFKTEWKNNELYVPEIPDILLNLMEMQEDDLLAIDATSIQVKPAGRAFIRNICMAFDLRLKEQRPERQLFSKTI